MVELHKLVVEIHHLVLMLLLLLAVALVVVVVGLIHQQVAQAVAVRLEVQEQLIHMVRLELLPKVMLVVMEFIQVEIIIHLVVEVAHLR